MKRNTILAIAAAVGLAALADARAASIGANFTGRGADPNSTLAPTDVAGVVAQPNWQNINGPQDDANRFDGITAPLLDSTGGYTAVRLQYIASDSWNSDGPTTTANDKLMKGVIKANPSDDAAAVITDGSDKVTFIFTNLSAGSYSVYVYLSVNGANAKIQVQGGATTYYVNEQASFSGTFVKATSTDPNVYQADANYVQFDNLAAVNGAVTIVCTKKIEQPQVNDGIGIAAVQIVSTGSFPANTTAPGVTVAAQPGDVLTTPNSAAAFSVTPDGPWAVRWQKNGVDIPGATGPNYTAQNVQLGDSGTKYRAIVSNNVKPDYISREATLTVANPVPTPGFLKAAYYENLNGTAVSDLLNSDAFKNNTPSSLSYLSSFQTPTGGDEHNNFGVEVYGWLTPTVSGDYYFFIRSDDASALYVNETGEAIPNPRTGTNPYDKDPVCQETGCCQAFQPIPAAGSPSTQTSSFTLFLEAGKKYGVLALMKEGGGGDYVQVAWSANPSVDPSTLTPIGTANLATEAVLPPGAAITITTQPAAAEAQELRTATFRVEADTTPDPTWPLSYQWYKNGAVIPGANAPAYTTPPLQMSDNNALFSVTMGTLAGITKSSDAAKLTVFPDTFPPLVVNAGGLQSTNGTTFDVGVTFDEPADTVTANDPTKYKVTPGGTVTAARYLGGSPGTLLTVSGLVVGNSYTVTVEGVKDLKGNTMPATPKPFKVSAMKWGETGGNEFGQKVQVIPVGVNGWDVYSDGMTAWAAYDESVTVYEAITGDFDKVVRVEYQDNSSQWARAGVIAKDVLNFGVNRAAQTGGAACRYQKAHISPVKTAMGTAGNNAWEGNRRLTTGAQTTGAGGGGTPEYPHAWARLQRIGQQFKIFRSNDGKAWVDYGTTNFDPPMPATLFVGPDYSPENGNVDQSLRQLWVAKFRDYGDFKVAVTPTISLNAQGQIVYEGTLVSSQTVDGTYAPVLGATSPYTMPKTGSGTFYRTQE